MAGTADRRRFVRDRLTVSLYGGFVTWGWFLYAFSPAVPLIADEQGISNGAAGLHGTAMAAGTVLTGFVSSTVALRLGRRVQLLIGAGVVVLGIALLISGATLAMTLPAVLVTSIGGGLVISAIQPALTVHHGSAGAAAVTEGNAIGATVGILAPLALGASVGLGWGWRPAVALVMLLAIGTGLLLVPLRSSGALGRGVRTSPGAAVSAAPARPTGAAPPPHRPRIARPARFSRTFGFFLAALVCGAAIEFSTTFWVPDLLMTRTGAPESSATSAVSALVLGMSVSRYVVGPLSMRKAPEKLLLVAYAVAGLGWLVLWLTTTQWVAVVGLVVAGLGYGAHYPLAVSLVLRSSGGRPDQAQARSTIAVGLAIGVSPFLLGTLADAFGAHRGFLLVPLLVVAGGTAVALGLRSVHREHRADAAP